MANINIKSVQNPIIVISGNYGTGKSYIHKLISKYIQSAVSLNKFDFITRKLLFILDIHPLQINYVLINDDLIDRELYFTNSNMIYLKDKINSEQTINLDSMKYFIEHILSIPLNLYSDPEIIILANRLNEIYSTKKIKDTKNLFYKMTTDLFYDIIDNVYNWDIKENVFKYLDSNLNEYKRIYDKFQKRIVYYAYDINEVLYFKEKYNAQNIFITMKSHLQTQLLIKENKTSDADTVISYKQQENVKLMRTHADFVIENNLEFDETLINKIMNAINI